MTHSTWKLAAHQLSEISWKLVAIISKAQALQTGAFTKEQLKINATSATKWS